MNTKPYAKPQVDKRTEGKKRRDARRKKVKGTPKDKLYSTGETTSEKISDFANKMHDKFGAMTGMSAEDIEARARRRLDTRELFKQIDAAQSLKDERRADRRYQQEQRKEAEKGVRRKELKALGLKKGGIAQAPIVSKKALKDSGFDNLRDFMNNYKYSETEGKYVKRSKALKRRKDPKPEAPLKSNSSKIIKDTRSKSQFDYKGPDPNQKNLTPSRSTARTDQEKSDFDLLAKNRKLRKETKFKKGGVVKTKKKVVKKFRGDGIARKGKTKGRMI